MSATRPSREHPVAGEYRQSRSRDVAELRARRRQARRRRRAARVDLGLGLLGALVLWIMTAGLAIAGLIALLVLALCALSVVLERRRRRGATRKAPRGAAQRRSSTKTAMSREVRRS